MQARVQGAVQLKDSTNPNWFLDNQTKVIYLYIYIYFCFVNWDKLAQISKGFGSLSNVKILIRENISTLFG
jgi:hypothetical protein